tara:strand:- start:106 stop:1170 length:1065 start_codon:yes stop_codon:yes gene_type:complete
MQKKILISTGGSGGHVIPALILFKHLLKSFDVILTTDKRGFHFFDKKIDKYKIINTPKLNNIFLLPFNLFQILFLIIKSIQFLKSEKIEKIISTGGYMSLPLILAAKFCRLKIYLFEPNLVLGRANKFFLNSCEKIFCYTDQIKSFPNRFKNKIVLVNPLVREEFYRNNYNSLKKNQFNLLVIGGSQGARIFDKNLRHSIVNLSKKYSIKITQQTNEKNISNLVQFYSENKIKNFIFSFNQNLREIIQDSDLCITRAGASTLAELSILNIPFLAVPLPTSKDNHQLENANFYKNKDCCWVVDQHLFEDNVEQILLDVLKNKKDFLRKKENLKKLNYQNTWINVNQKILNTINEN